jgi:hypothetical protein
MFERELQQGVGAGKFQPVGYVGTMAIHSADADKQVFRDFRAGPGVGHHPKDGLVPKIETTS